MLSLQYPGKYQYSTTDINITISRDVFGIFKDHSTLNLQPSVFLKEGLPDFSRYFSQSR